MQYYLRHYFNPDFDYLHLKPGGEDDASDVYSLGYVQNAICGQVLAELVPLDQVTEKRDPRFILDQPTFPMGANTCTAPSNPNFLLSTINGYVFYLDGNITVKNLLNVRKDVSFETGNIFFVGNMAIHGSVRAGFSVQGNNVRILGMLEGGVARSRRDMMIDGGARGGAGGHGKIDAGGKLLTQFLERVEARTRGNMVIKKNCLHCIVYAGSNLVVQEKLYGGVINAYGSVYVGEQIGNRAAISTRIYLGYAPHLIRQLEKIDQIIANQSQSITHLTAIAGHLPPDATEASRKLHSLRVQRQQLVLRREYLWNTLYLDEKFVQNCRLICPGTIFPGVEISIGRAFLTVEDQHCGVFFHMKGDDIVMEPWKAPKNTDTTL
ncbi:MAG: DUF342 domain-containing protein [Desulfovibrio sp.]|nr:DUF342 domain-containing protein [Desulfovibrio sp.]